MSLSAEQQTTDPTDARLRQTERAWPLLTMSLILLAGAVAVAIGLYANRFGPELDTDSAVYLATGIRLAHGQGVSMPNAGGPPEPMSLFPPLLPALIAILVRVHLSPIPAIGTINALSWGLLAVLTGMAVRGLTPRSVALPALAAGAMALNPVMYRVHASLLTEPLCLLWMFGTFGCLWACGIYRRRAIGVQLGLAALAGTLAAGAILTRYAAATLIPTGWIAFLILHDTWRRRIGSGAIFAFVAALPAVAWTIFNRLPGQLPAQRHFDWHPVTVAKLRQGMETVAAFILPAGLPWSAAPPITFWVFVGLALALAGYLLRRGLSGGGIRNTPPLVVACAAFILIYPLFPIVSISLADAGIPLDWRILAPIFPAGVIVVAYIGYAIAWAPGRFGARALLCSAAMAQLGGQFYQTLTEVATRTDESVLAWSVSRSSATLDAVRSLPPDRFVVSNHPGLLYVFAGRLNDALPGPPADRVATPSDDVIDDEVDDLRRALAPAGGWVVYWNNESLDDFDDPVIPLEVVRSHFVINEMRKTEDGLLLRIDDPEGTPETQWGADEVHTSGPWRLEKTNGAKAAMSVDGDATLFDITAVDGTDWHVQASHTGLDLQDGRKYVVKFKARASARRALEIDATIEQDDYHDIGLDESFELDRDWDDYRFEFTASRTVPGKNSVSFIMGSATGKIWVRGLTITQSKASP